MSCLVKHGFTRLKVFFNIKQFRLLQLLPLLLIGGSAFAQSAGENSSNESDLQFEGSLPAEGSLPNEIVQEVQEMVITTRQSLSKLRSQISEAEDKIYSLFNDYNVDDRYDIHCNFETSINTRIKKKECTPQYVDDAKRQNALTMLGAFQGSSYSNNMGPSVNLVIVREADTMNEKFSEAVLQNPGLYNAIIEHYELEEEYKRRQKEN